MYRIITLITCLVVLGSTVTAQVGPTHVPWSNLLKKHVNDYGLVNYKGFKADEVKLDAYLEELANNPPNTSWKIDMQQAYWINAYNAFTIKLILNHYPIKSIMDIKQDGKDAWHIPFIVIGKKRMTLDYIENTMLRGQFNDSRIHFALNCSAVSCPPLKNSAYTGNNLNIDLRLAARRFINDKRFNVVSADHLQLSEIFNWYKADFLKEEASIQVYVNKRTPHTEVSANASLNYLPYDWNLNEQKK